MRNLIPHLLVLLVLVILTLSGCATFRAVANAVTDSPLLTQVVIETMLQQQPGWQAEAAEIAGKVKSALGEIPTLDEAALLAERELDNAGLLPAQRALAGEMLLAIKTTLDQDLTKAGLVTAEERAPRILGFIDWLAAQG